jgi:hypothetical protein
MGKVFLILREEKHVSNLTRGMLIHCMLEQLVATVNASSVTSGNATPHSALTIPLCFHCQTL